MTRIAWAMSITLSAALGGCLAAPKEIGLAPAAEVSATGIGGGRNVGVSCVDSRPERQGGIAAGSYVLDPDTDVAGALCRATADGLARMGFVPAIGAAPGGLQLRVEMVRIAHAVGPGNFKRAVEVEANLRATAVSGGGQYTTTYRAQRMREVAFSPRKETVQALSDETVSAALSRILSDQAVLAVLSGGGGGAAAPTPAPVVNETDTQTFPYR